MSSLFMDDRHITDPNEIREGWASYFKVIANPDDTQNNYNEEYREHVELNMLLLKNMCSNTDSEEDIVVPVELVHKIISGLRNGKVAYIKGLKSEHLKYRGEAVINYVSY